ncbi:MAG: MFS transporter [Chloroflexi bacterium]|nr:MFS transporter [Chloroflexota bacterium]
MLRLLKKPFYGWWIVAAGVVSQMLQGGLYLYGFSLFFLPLIQEFGWTRTSLSAVFSFSRLESGIFGPLEGWLVDKFGPRRMMALGVPIMGLGFILLSQTSSFFMFAAVFFLLIATGSSLGLVVPCYTATANWFIRKRGLAMGFLSAGTGLGGGAILFLAWIVNEYGWRVGAMAAGVTVLVVGTPLGLLMRHRPEQYGYLPDGARANSTGAGDGDGAPQAYLQEADFTARQAIQTSGFWLLTLSFAVRQTTVGAVAVHLMPFFIGAGFSSEVAATLLAAVSLVSILGRLSFGWLADIFEKRHVMVFTVGCIALSMFFLAGVYELWQAVLWVFIYALGYGGGAPLMPALRAEFFGRKSFGTVQGTMLAFQMWGLMVGPLSSGLMYDLLGDYRPSFLAFGAANFIGVFLLFLARRPRPGGRGSGIGGRV